MFTTQYPHIARWVQDFGWIEVGYDYNQSFLRALDIGGMIWEGEYKYSTVEEAFQALENALAARMREQGFG